MTLRKALRLCLWIVAVYLLFCLVAGIFLAEFALHPSRHPVSAGDEAHAPEWASEDGALLSEVNITAADGIRLQAWVVEPEDGNGDFVILLHGLKGNRLEMVNYADMLLVHGYSVLMPDARAHGASGGDIATYGLLERDDIHRWVDWLINNRHPHCIYGFGESMGAAQLLQALGPEPRFCAVIAECPFSTFGESAYDRMGQRFHTGPWLGRTILRPLIESSLFYVRERYKLNMNLVSPENAVAGTRVPVLLIHGQSDTNIPVRHSRRIAARNSELVLWEIPDTGHSNAIDTSPQELERRVVQWFQSNSR